MNTHTLPVIVLAIAALLVVSCKEESKEGDTILPVIVDAPAKAGSFDGTLQIDGLGTLQQTLIADADGNGNNDVLTVSSADAFIRIYFGGGHGFFYDPEFVPTVATGPSIATADFNNDGKLDIVATSNTGNSLEVLLGRGDFRFTSTSLMATNGSANDLVIADFDQDGNQDVALRSGSNIEIFYGSGDGLFASQTVITTINSTLALVTANFDNANGPDLAYSTNASQIVILSNNGSGILTAGTPVSAGLIGNAVSLAVLEYDQNTNPDLAAADSGGAQIVIYPGNGNGTFGSVQTAPLNWWATGLATGDINGDGEDDIVAGQSGGSNIGILINTGAANFNTVVDQDLGGNNISSVFCRRLDGDSSDDVAAISSNTGTLNILRGSSSGTTIQPAIVAVQDQPMRISIGNIDGINGPDALVANPGANDSVSALTNDGSGTLSVASTSTAGSSPMDVLLVDLDANGSLDLVACNNSDSNLSVRLGNGDGTFGTETNPPTANAGAAPEQLAFGHFSNDTNIDVVVATAGNSTFEWFAGDGSGGLTATAVSTGAAPTAIAAGDVTGDGNDDVVIGYANTIKVYAGDGSSGFAAAITVAIAGTPTSIRTGFANTDSALDIFVATSMGLSVIRSNGSGGFITSVSYLPVGGVGDIAVSDFNRDGVQDIAMTVGNQVVVAFGTGAGGYAVRARWYVAGATGIAAADFNQDGIQDLIVSQTGSDQVSVIYGR